MTQLRYHSGLHLLECLRLRVNDVAFDYRPITVHDGKGQKDRRTMLPLHLIAPLRQYLQQVQAIHTDDLRLGYGAIFLPEALVRKFPNAERAWLWQEVFPAHRRSSDPCAGIVAYAATDSGHMPEPAAGMGLPAG